MREKEMREEWEMLQRDKEEDEEDVEVLHKKNMEAFNMEAAVNECRRAEIAISKRVESIKDQLFSYLKSEMNLLGTIRSEKDLSFLSRLAFVVLPHSNHYLHLHSPTHSVTPPALPTIRETSPSPSPTLPFPHPPPLPSPPPPRAITPPLDSLTVTSPWLPPLVYNYNVDRFGAIYL